MSVYMAVQDKANEGGSGEYFLLSHDDGFSWKCAVCLGESIKSQDEMESRLNDNRNEFEEGDVIFTKFGTFQVWADWRGCTYVELMEE